MIVLLPTRDMLLFVGRDPQDPCAGCGLQRVQQRAGALAAPCAWSLHRGTQDSISWEAGRSLGFILVGLSTCSAT